MSLSSKRLAGRRLRALAELQGEQDGVKHLL
jgi:hypothetical protein